MKSVNRYINKKYPTIPAEGWLKPCYHCETITSRFLVLDNYKYYFCCGCFRNKQFRILKLYHTFEIDSIQLEQ